MSKAVFVEGNDKLTEEMFLKAGWTIVNQPIGVDLICFTGGEDVSPMLYESIKLGVTLNDPQRDERCCNIFYNNRGVPMVGICRGAQFLNVMMGGELYQDVDGHQKDHDAYNPATGEYIGVSSVHHQMMIPTDEAEVVLVCHESTKRQPVNDFYNEEPEVDIEAVLYEDEKVFCFQPHPEYHTDSHQCQKFFFEYVNELVKDK